MEEDIKLQSVEDLIKNIEEYGYIDARLGKIDDYEIDSILYYLKDYQKLQKENEEWSKAYQEEKDKQFDLLINTIPKQVIRDKIEEIKKSRDLANELIEHKVVIADSDSLNYGRKEAHDYDIAILQEILEESGGK